MIMFPIFRTLLRGSLVPTTIAMTVLFSSCGPTVFDESLASTSTQAPTTTEPTGTVGELLTRLSTAMNSLSDLIGPNQSGKTPAGRGEQIVLIQSIWSAVEESVTTIDPDVADSLTRMVALAQTAVERNRPADADKAARFAGQVIDDFLSRQA
jgi:hypothetical protein